MTRPITPGESPAFWRSLVHRTLITPLLPQPRLRRLVQLCVGLYLFGLGLAAQVRPGWVPPRGMCCTKACTCGPAGRSARG